MTCSDFFRRETQKPENSGILMAKKLDKCRYGTKTTILKRTTIQYTLYIYVCGPKYIEHIFDYLTILTAAQQSKAFFSGTTSVSLQDISTSHMASGLWAIVEAEGIPSGKLTVCYGKSPFLMGKLTINGHFQ